MKTYMHVLLLLVAGLLLAVLGLTLVTGGYWDEDLVGEEWCEMMMEKPNPQWMDSETRRFAKDCLYTNQ